MRLEVQLFMKLFKFLLRFCKVHAAPHRAVNLFYDYRVRNDFFDFFEKLVGFSGVVERRKYCFRHPHVRVKRNVSFHFIVAKFYRFCAVNELIARLFK